MASEPLSPESGNFSVAPAEIKSHRLQLFLLELMVINTWCGDFIRLFDVFVCQVAVLFNASWYVSHRHVGPRPSAVPFDAFLRMSFHVVGTKQLP